MSYKHEVTARYLGLDNILDAACAEVDALRARLAALERDGERLDAIPHGWRIGHEAGASGHSDHWYIWTTDWSQPLGEGATLREALDAARQADAAKEGGKL
jgi:hypothetical protein